MKTNEKTIENNTKTIIYTKYANVFLFPFPFNMTKNAREKKLHLG